MDYTLDVSEELEQEKVLVLRRLSSLLNCLTQKVASRIANPRAREYLLHGVCRRLNVLRRCIHNVFEVFPSTRDTLLSQDERTDIQIYLHASFVNTYGFFDNLAWVCVIESGAESKLKRHEVGIFLKETRGYLPDQLRDAVQLPGIRDWYFVYAKNFRDALSHRIPPYVPPFRIPPEQVGFYEELEIKVAESISRAEWSHANELRREQGKIGSISAAVLHSYSDEDASPPVYLHPQLIADGNTVVMVGNAYADSFREET